MHAESRIAPKTIGPGIEPKIRKETDCTPRASVLCSSATHLEEIHAEYCHCHSKHHVILCTVGFCPLGSPCSVKLLIGCSMPKLREMHGLVYDKNSYLGRMGDVPEE